MTVSGITSTGAGATTLPPDPAADLIARHSARGSVDVGGLADELRANGNATLAAQVSARLSPVDRGELERALRPAGGNEEGLGAFVDGAIRGDFSDNNSWSKLGGQTVVGFIPIAGQIADARDTAAAIGQVWNGEEGGWANLGAAALGWIPGVGDAAKGLIRGGSHAAEASGDLASAVARHGDEAATLTRPRIEMDGGSKGDWPPELNARTLTPNADYVVNGYTYRTDAAGRVENVSGRLELHTADRNGYQQQVSGREDRLPDDQGGHLIASIFNGPGDRLNLVPMDGNFNMGAWRDVERRLQTALDGGKTVDVRIDVRYAEGQRPTAFRIEYTIDGQTSRETFRNRPGG
jgi:hypothetical protein